MKKRIISAILTIPILVFIFYLGGLALYLLLLALSLAGFNELSQLVSKMPERSRPYKALGYTGVFLILTALYIGQLYSFIISITLIVFFSAGWKLMFYRESSLDRIGVTLFCIFYISWTFGFLIAIRGLSDGFFLLIMVIFIIWATDTGAYFSGISFGKTRLAPEVSPNKSVEGSIGGTLIAVLVAVIIGKSLGLTVSMAVMIGVLTSLLSQFGDLVQSALKRTAKIKDSGDLIPGHGGIMDRFDSFLLAPSTFYVIMLLLGY